MKQERIVSVFGQFIDLDSIIAISDVRFYSDWDDFKSNIFLFTITCKLLNKPITIIKHNRELHYTSDDDSRFKELKTKIEQEFKEKIIEFINMWKNYINQSKNEKE